MAVETSLRELREATVLEHMTAENDHDFERCIAAFGHPRYEIVPTGEVWDGHDGVNALLRDDTALLLLAGNQDQIAIHHRVSTRLRLTDEYVHGSPDALSERELHRRAMDLAMRPCSPAPGRDCRV